MTLLDTNAILRYLLADLPEQTDDKKLNNKLKSL